MGWNLLNRKEHGKLIKTRVQRIWGPTVGATPVETKHQYDYWCGCKHAEYSFRDDGQGTTWKKDMLTLKLAMEKENEQENEKGTRKRQSEGGQAKSGNAVKLERKPDHQLKEGEEPAEKIQAKKKGEKKPTQKAPAKLPPKTQSGAKAKGKRALEASTSS